MTTLQESPTTHEVHDFMSPTTPPTAVVVSSAANAAVPLLPPSPHAYEFIVNVAPPETMEGDSPLTNVESKMTLDDYAKAISVAHLNCETVDKESRMKGREAVQWAFKAGQYLNAVKDLVPHGQWLPWLKQSCPEIKERTAQRYMVAAKTVSVTDLKKFQSVRQYEIATGAITPERHDSPPGVNAAETDRDVEAVTPEILLSKMQNGFVAIQRQYNELLKLKPDLQTHLLGIEEKLPLPILLQRWQFPLKDAFDVFEVPTMLINCVRCGKERQLDDIFVPIHHWCPEYAFRNEWCEACANDCNHFIPREKFNITQEIQLLQSNLNELKAMDAKVYTLYQKHSQLQNITIATPEEITAVENNVWMPTDLTDEALTLGEIQKMTPKIVLCKDAPQMKLWEIYKHITASSDYNRPPTRNIFFLVVDDSQPNKPVLGIGCASGDMMAVRERDDFIGWTKEQRQGVKDANGNVIKPAMTRHTANGTTIIPTQPFGYNFLGGKLIAALITSQVIRDEWKSKYGDVLTGLTTTSLFGREAGTMYDAVKQWKGLGKTTGRVPIAPRYDIWQRWKDFVAAAYTHELNGVTARDDNGKNPVTNEKTKELTLIFKAAGLRLGDYEHGHKRGLYFSEVYENTKEFLCGKIGENELRLKPLFQETVEEIVNRWKKQAEKRYLKLKADGKLDSTKVSYSQLGQMDFETARKTYLGNDEQ